MSVSVRMSGVSQRFGDVVALDEVEFSAGERSIHAIVGENGAGKTTLMRVLYGALVPDAGSIELFGESVNFRSSAEAIQRGIGMVAQHYSILPELTCLQNLIIGAEGGAMIHRTQAEKRGTKLAASMNFRLDWNSPSEMLSPSQAQRLEILKLLWRDAKIMILDEPTAMLSPTDASALFQALRQLASLGATVIVVTHRVAEVLEHCDAVSVMRRGKMIVQQPVEGLTPDKLSELMIGEILTAEAVASKRSESHELLHLEAVEADPLKGGFGLRGVSLRLNEGEVLGIAGVDGNGQQSLVHAIIGLAKLRTGTVSFQGTDISHASVGKRIQLGMRIIPEDRHEEALMASRSLVENAALGVQRSKLVGDGNRFDSTKLIDWTKAALLRFDAKFDSIRDLVDELSGGNQQRFVAGRAIESWPKLLLAFQPVRGLDLRAARSVYAAIRTICAADAAAIVVSFDLDELLTHCDSIAVMWKGRLIFPPSERRRDAGILGRLMIVGEEGLV